MPPLSVRAFASKLGVSHVAVLKGIKAKRLLHSVQINAKGHAEIVDFDLAKREWETNASKPPKVESPVVVTQPPVSVTTVTTPPPDTVIEGIGAAGPLHATSLVEAQRLLTLEKLRKQRLDIETEIGHLVLKTDVAKVLYEGDKILRENILNVPARISGSLAATTDAGEVYRMLDAALREALAATAGKYQEQAAALG